MKYLIPLIFTLFFFGCDSQKEKQSENPNGKESKELEQETTNLDTQVALNFINEYIENCNKMNAATEIVEWTNASPFVTQKFKTELKEMVNKAWKENPEMGLGFNPIFNAQDYPEKGVELHDFNSETGNVIVKGIGWESFKLSLKLVNQNGKTLVDGCGVINVPE